MSLDPQEMLSRIVRPRLPRQTQQVVRPTEPSRSPSETLKLYRENPDVLREKLQLSPQTDPIILGLQWEYPPSQDDKAPRDFSQGSPGEPFAVSRDLLKNGHMHIRGRTRSGKSSLAITPLLAQLARPYAAYAPDGTLVRSDFKDAIFVFDLGGDLALFNFARNLAQQNPDRTFRFLSLEREDDWHYFDPIQEAASGADRLIRIAILLQQAFSLDHGLVYGGSYYSQRNLSALLHVARTIAQQPGGMTNRITIDDISRCLDQKQVKDADEIRMIFQFLLEYDQLKPPDQPTDKVINMERALRDAEIIYFFCPTIGEAMTARQIAGLGLYTLINAAMQRVRTLKPQERGKPLPHAWVFVDEFQELAGRSYASLLAQASKFGLSLIMANQTTTQLSTRDLGLADIVRDNTFAKMYFTVTGEDDIRAIQSFSKESSRMLAGKSESVRAFEFNASESVSQTEIIVPALKTDEILDTSSTDKHCFLILDDGSRHREPMRLWTDFALDPKTFHEYKQTPPPKITEPRGPSIQSTDPQEPLWKIARRRNGVGNWQAPLANLLAQKRAEEQPVES